MTPLSLFLIVTYVFGVVTFLVNHKKEWNKLEGFDFLLFSLHIFIGLIWPVALYFRGISELVKHV